MLTSFEERLGFKISHHNERTDLISDNTIQLRDRNNSSDILRRLSTRNFSAVHISYEEISTVLSQLKIQEIFGGTHSIYATAGGVYPVQIYIAVNDNFADGIKGGVYYFNQRKNTLVMTDSHTDAFGNICVEGNRNIAENAAFAMFFVSDMSVITPLYGNRSRDFCLIECGLIAQTVERICSENGLATCQIGSWTNEQSLFKSMKLNSENEILHMMYLGKADLCDTARAFIVQKNVSDLIEKECRKRLPSYEIPAFITEINEIPLTSNGKVDEKRLAEVSENVPQSVEKFTATDDITERVYNIYLSNSGQDKLRTDQNIWEAGINSLAATKIWRQLQENFGISFNIAVIFEKATIINMAEYVKSLLNNKKANEPAIADNETEKFLKRNELRKNAVRRRMQRG